jgi:hypothetical protein
MYPVDFHVPPIYWHNANRHLLVSKRLFIGDEQMFDMSKNLKPVAIVAIALFPEISISSNLFFSCFERRSRFHRRERSLFKLIQFICYVDEILVSAFAGGVGNSGSN